MGTRGVHTLTPLGEKARAVLAIRSKSGSALVVDNDTRLFSESLRYLISINPNCAGWQADLCHAGECRRVRSPRRRVRLMYARAEDGAIGVD
jgi:hypothetical protein